MNTLSYTIIISLYYDHTHSIYGHGIPSSYLYNMNISPYMVMGVYTCYYRDIIEAMQDSSAGVKLHELRRGRLGRHVDKYFTGTRTHVILAGLIPFDHIHAGTAAVDWLITWYFATTRSEAITLCNSMLTNGLFHAIIEEDNRGGLVKSTIANDRRACHQFEDSENARYIFVS